MKHYKSPLLYTGDKYKLVEHILNIEEKNNSDYFIDVFCGGGVVGINSYSNNIILNDVNKKIFYLHHLLLNNNAEIIHKRLLTLKKKFKLKDSFDIDIEVKKEHPKKYLSKINYHNYLTLRESYNRNYRTDYLLLLIMYSFNHQLRFNSKGKFNLPVGNLGIPINYYDLLKNYKNKTSKKNVTVTNLDFKTVINKNIKLKNTTFYLDPPYTDTTAQYNSYWSKKNDEILVMLVNKIHKNGNKFILSNISTNIDLIKKLNKYNIKYINHTHISFKKNKVIQEVIIYN